MTLDPYFVQGPAVLSFSGGRTSGYLLKEVVLRGLQPNVHVVFANTGKERTETLDFVHECSVRFGVTIIWLEYHRLYLPKYKKPERAEAARRARAAVGREFAYEPARGRKEPGYRIVSYETASRNAEPFDNMIDLNGLPNRQLRICTAEMKIRVIKKWMRAQGYDYWDVILGLRADEPKRVARKRTPTKERWEHMMPLADAGVTVDDVMHYWKQTSKFDLQLEPYEGNCDNCFLKTLAKRRRIAQEHPEFNEWWERSEARAGEPFNRNEPSYSKLRSLPVVYDEPQDGIDCDCTD